MSDDEFEGFDPEIESAFNGGFAFGLAKFNPDTRSFIGVTPIVEADHE